MDDGAEERRDKVLDPYSCLSKKNIKAAALTEELYLSNRLGTSLSPSFVDFTSLSVLWLNDNNLTRLDNIDACFRIREVYVQNNKLLSLSFLPKLKFIQVLLASNNQIKNLDKQMPLLTRSSFLKKLDLFDNAVADEPDYKLRVIYHAPQVEILDRTGVTLAHRQRAQELVPNMDKASIGPPAKCVKSNSSFTVLEQDCFRTAKMLHERRRKADDDFYRTQTFTRSASLGMLAPKPKHLIEGTERWNNPWDRRSEWPLGRRNEEEQLRPSPWEKAEMSSHIEQLVFPKPLVVEEEVDPKGKKDAGKGKKDAPPADPSADQTVSAKDVAALARRLATEGLEDVGRVLVTSDVFAPLPATPRETGASWRQTRKKDGQDIGGRGKAHPLEKLMADPEAVMPLKDVTRYLLSLDWRRPEDNELDEKIAGHYAAAKLADLQGDQDAVAHRRTTALRLEGAKTLKGGVNVFKRTPPPPPLPRTRSDVFHQSMLRPAWVVDEDTGRTVLRVSQEKHSKTLKMH